MGEDEEMKCHICGKEFQKEDIQYVPIRIGDEIKLTNGMKTPDGDEMYFCPDHFQIALFVYEASRGGFEIAWEDS